MCVEGMLVMIGKTSTRDIARDLVKKIYTSM